MNAPEPVGTGHPRATQLLQRIEAHGFDAPDDPLGFESRLADDNGWTLGYARIVVAEYRRFLVLTQLAKDPVSPSQDVDQAWHLHLTRTAHYAAFCDALFGRFLHHEPGRSDGGDAQRHRDMYEYTRTVYRRGFGEAPPEAVWPRPGRPLPPDPVPAARWTVPPLLQPGRRLGWACVALALLLGLLPGALRLAWPLTGSSIEVFMGEAAAVGCLIAWMMSRMSEPQRAPHRRDTLDPSEVAWFGGGAPRMAMTAIASLVERGVLLQPAEADRVGLPRHALAVDRSASAPARHPVEAACLRAATDAGLRFADACTAVRFLADACERRLAAAGLVADRGTMPLARARVLAVSTLWLAVCVARCRSTFMDGASIPSVVVVAVTGASVLLLLRLARRPTRVAARAQGAMKALGARFRRPRAASVAAAAAAPIAGDALAIGVALMGTAAFAGDARFAGLDDKFGALGPTARQLTRKKLQDDESGSGFGVVSGIGSAFGGLFGASCGSPGSADCGSGGSGGDVDRGAASWDAGGSVDLGGSSGDDGGGSSCSGGGSSCSGGSSCGGGGSSCGGGSSD
jgi:uncharacterized protein (TIGR04222 family)